MNKQKKIASSSNGKLNYSATDFNALTITITDITGNIIAADFTISVSRIT